MLCRLLFLLASGVMLAGRAQAAEADHVTASHAWIRLLPGELPASGYVALRNNGVSNAVLVGAHSKAYASVMLHQSTQDAGGMDRMTTVSRLAIPAQGEVSLAPASYHLMLEQAASPPKVGDTIDITLDFADGSHLPVAFLVRPANAADAN
ncbi:copper chaperone PCu(A)C [Dyella psychrodurans]|uniref:Copper chaperone PCu(A)C n=1 Tax=Dyella psychrodurans TaxID=1927960 RepID=A0A370XE97_9GAMM|nr:copper chaperone PCu(A)C [Dyella psychrodurans]RDS86748.1 copper chaperone PCu(A)C [Dyella psychrodurans]